MLTLSNPSRKWSAKSHPGFMHHFCGSKTFPFHQPSKWEGKWQHCAWVEAFVNVPDHSQSHTYTWSHIVYTHTALTCSHTHVYIEQTHTPGFTHLHTHVSYTLAHTHVHTYSTPLTITQIYLVSDTHNLHTHTHTGPTCSHTLMYTHTYTAHTNTL